MSRTSEARFWQAIGLVVGVAGALLLAYTFGRYGPASIDHTALQYGMTSGFMMLAGAAAFVAGRAFHVEEVGLTWHESALWNLLSAVCILGGIAIVIFAKAHPQMLILDRLATGIAGGFGMILGVLCLVGQRIMTHMNDALVVNKPEQKAWTAVVGGRSSH